MKKIRSILFFISVFMSLGASVNADENPPEKTLENCGEAVDTETQEKGTGSSGSGAEEDQKEGATGT